MIGKGKKSHGGVLSAVLAWLITAIACLLLGAVVVSKSGLRQGSLPWLSAAAVFLSSSAAAFCYARGGEGKRGKYGGVVGPVCAVVLLMAGFLIDSEKMTLVGLARTVFSAVIGGMAGAAIPAGLHRPARGRKFSVRSRVG